jgi:hypothetical protein
VSPRLHHWTQYPPNQKHYYKCLDCSAIGWLDTRPRPFRVIAYKCMRRGCDEDAVIIVNGVRLCLEHKHTEDS